MSDWVVTALIGLGNEPEEAENIATVFRAIRTRADPDALQVFLGVVAEMGNQAEAKIDAAEAEVTRLRAERERLAGDNAILKKALVKMDALEREVHDYRNLMDSLIGVYERDWMGAKASAPAVAMREYVRSTQLHIRKWQTAALATSGGAGAQAEQEMR